MINNTKIGTKLKGRKILDVVIDSSIERDEDKDNYLEVDGEECYILLDDGSVIKCWNSEWGGVTLGTIKKQENPHTHEEQIQFIDA